MTKLHIHKEWSFASTLALPKCRRPFVTRLWHGRQAQYQDILISYRLSIPVPAADTCSLGPGGEFAT